MIHRGTVPAISVSQVGRYLAQAELQPHRSKYWLNSKEKDPVLFEQQVQIVCQTYLDAPDLYFQENTHTVSVDEMPSIQALERIAKTIPMQSGQPERIEYEYKRHGTWCLIGNWHVVLGSNNRTDHPRDTHRRRLCVAHSSHNPDRREGELGIRGGQFEYPL